MNNKIFTIEECKYIKSFYDPSTEKNGQSATTVTRDNGTTFEIRYRKANKSTYSIIENETLNSFLIKKLTSYKVVSLDSVKIMKYRIGDGLAPHYDLAGYGYKGNYMTLSVMLTDGTEFEGGDLLVEGVPQPREIGSVSTFLRNQKHEVTTVTKGERCTLVLFLSEDNLDLKKSLF